MFGQLLSNELLAHSRAFAPAVVQSTELLIELEILAVEVAHLLDKLQFFLGPLTVETLDREVAVVLLLFLLVPPVELVQLLHKGVGVGAFHYSGRHLVFRVARLSCRCLGSRIELIKLSF